MAAPNPIDSSDRRGFPNPFYVALVVVSTAFVVTAIAYLMGPSVAARSDPDDASAARFVAVFDRYGPTALAVEFVVMLLTGLAAMLTDRLFPGRRRR